MPALGGRFDQLEAGVQLGGVAGVIGVDEPRLAADLADRFGSIDRLSEASEEELASIDDIGERTASDITEFFRNNSDLDKNLRACGVSPHAEKKKNGILSGEKAVLTGRLLSMTRSQAAAAVEAHGGTVQSSVTKETTLVIAGEDAGSKLDKARAAGIRVIGEKEFLSLINA